ncbi:MAG: ammonium transporter [Candidatus Lokiarchaeota archaeon]|nr:ammonium transporter [Candidatus Lokiarchaeota archaeon]
MLLQVDTGNASWILTATCLVLIMTPGLAMFYGGLIRKKNVLAMFGLCVAAMIAVSIQWFLVGYSMAFGNSIGGFVGDLSYAGLNDVFLMHETATGVPATVFVVFQCMFAMITAAILASPFAERSKFGSFLVFISIWSLIVYNPIAHWVWATGGFLSQAGVLDFAGGTVVHVNVGFSAAAVALVIGKRQGFKKDPMEPHNIPMVAMGLGLLWFGWLGFNGGSALAANEFAGLAIINTNLAACTAALVWIVLEYVDKGKKKPSMIGISTGVLAGLVAITPAAGYVQPWGAFMIGLLVDFAVYPVLKWRTRSNLDESLDAFACHGIGGVTGAILTGVFASVNGATGLVAGDATQVAIQAFGVVCAAGFAFGVTLVLAFLLKKTIKLRVKPDEEYVGCDVSVHNEIAYV